MKKYVDKKRAKVDNYKVKDLVMLSTKTSPFKANYGQDPRMGFEGRKKGKYVGAEKFVEKIRKIQEV